MDDAKGAMGILTFLILLPLIGSAAIGIGSRWPGWPRRLALLFSLGTFALSLLVWARFDSTVASYQLVESVPWIPSFGISYLVAVDGVSLLLVSLTAILTPLSVLASWESIQEKVSAFYAVLLVLESFLIGVFLAVDVFLFYVLWEALLVPAFLLIGVWGGRRRVEAATKFFLFTMGGSIFFLVGILVCYELHNVQAGTPSFDLRTWQGLVMSDELQRWLFLAFFVGCAVKIPLFPLHAWLPDAHGEAPTAGSVIFAGVLLKLGVYGLLRFAVPLFPEGARAFAPAILTIAIIGILYGALVAMVQPDVKRLVAYSSLSHLGFVALGIFSFDVAGVEGAIYQMVSHGITTGALFLLVGMIHERRQTYVIEDLGGLKATMPRFAGVFLIVLLSSIGLPGLNGFVGELLILLGAFQTAPSFAVAAGIGVILVAGYLLWMYKRVMLGESPQPARRRPPAAASRSSGGRGRTKSEAAASEVAGGRAGAISPWKLPSEERGSRDDRDGAGPRGTERSPNATQDGLQDLTRRESVILLPIVILIFWMGLAPGGFLRMLDGTAKAIIPVAPVGVLEE